MKTDKNKETPTITATDYGRGINWNLTSSSYTSDNTNPVINQLRYIVAERGGINRTREWQDPNPYDPYDEDEDHPHQIGYLHHHLNDLYDNEEDEAMANQESRRLVKVIIVDPDQDVPLDQCVLYSGEEKMTEATNEELFFELDVKGLLDAHNEKRKKIKVKNADGKYEPLEPVKIRNLRMAVIDIAQF